MGLWESVIIVSIFSVIVIVSDEWLHARRRKRKAKEGAARVGH
jgi:hypothetical protein